LAVPKLNSHFEDKTSITINMAKLMMKILAAMLESLVHRIHSTLCFIVL